MCVLHVARGCHSKFRTIVTVSPKKIDLISVILRNCLVLRVINFSREAGSLIVRCMGKENFCLRGERHLLLLFLPHSLLARSHCGGNVSITCLTDISVASPPFGADPDSKSPLKRPQKMWSLKTAPLLHGNGIISNC